MGEIVAFEKEPNPPSFTINVTTDDSNTWQVSILEFYDHQMPESEVLREIAEALVPIAGGLIHNAEQMERTTRGNIVANVSFYESGYMDFHSAPINTKERYDWFMAALAEVGKTVLAAYERQANSDET